MAALDDSFHDGDGPARLSRGDRENISALQRGRGRAWIWITGNHDPEPAAGIGGEFQAALAIGALTFRHLPSRVAGNFRDLHPVARASLIAAVS